jgi:hypothetical protein
VATAHAVQLSEYGRLSEQPRPAAGVAGAIKDRGADQGYLWPPSGALLLAITLR